MLEIAKTNQLLSIDHFTVDRTLLEAWASLKRFKQKDEKDSRKDDGDPCNPSVDFHVEKRNNDTYESTTDPESKLYRKSKGH